MRQFLLVAAMLFTPAVAGACIWDVDTLAAERGRFPTVLEVITGKFLRHSPEYYAWRVQDRKRKIAADPAELANYDDLAVAYDKLGKQDLAIETILAKDKIEPGLYETEANLGTFLIHAGRYEEGLKHIRRAIEINPDAHFGREKYQVLLTEYLVPRLKDGKPQLPLQDVVLAGNEEGESFAQFLRRDKEHALTPDEVKEAITGVLGIMRFSKHDSHVLLEALASLLREDGTGSGELDAKLLAARAYITAANSVDAEPTSTAYNTVAMEVLAEQEDATLDLTRRELDVDREDADEWYARLRERELNWIQSGADVDAEFARLYFKEPRLSRPGNWFGLDMRAWIIAGSLSLALVISVSSLIRLRISSARRRANTA